MYKSLRRVFPVAFPMPSLLASIEDLLEEVYWLEGVILITESKSPTFISISQINNLYNRLCVHPKGKVVKELIRKFVERKNSINSTKPVLVLESNGRYWLGLIGLHNSPSAGQDKVQHLNRCYKLIR